MRFAISAENANGLASRVSAHFGRCPFFVLVDLDESGRVAEVRSVANPYYGNHACGDVSHFVHSQGANVLITGGIGGGAASQFDRLGVEVAAGATGTVEQAIEDYFDGRLAAGASCSGGHGGCH